MSYFPQKLEVLNKDCPCNFTRVWGGPYSSFWHGLTPTMWTCGDKIDLVPLRLREPLTTIRGTDE
jgi:hypothetical protein